MRRLVATLSLLILPALALGHHSRAEFSDETVEVEGILTRVVWQNPHIAFFLDVETESGDVETWRVEGWTNPAALVRAGVTPDLFEPGDRLVVAGRPSKIRNAVLVTNALLADGTEAVMAPRVEQRWDGPAIGDASQPAPRMVDAMAENRGFFRAWYPSGNPMMTMRRLPYTEQAVAARADWNPIDNPIVRCEQPGMPFPFFHPRPILFTEDGQNISLHHAYFDTRRTIHVDDGLSADDQPRSRLGFSKATWQNEHTLVIETTGIDYPYFDHSGTIQGSAIEFTERYSLSEDQTRLDLQLIIDDPVAFTETVTIDWHFLALDQPFSVYECNVF
ncbi:MAG: DUF6152 family protein [Gammaproteobacteria bacterium]|nr:DUF6152 family protein [Gammaproteobacteria bacterium]MDH3507762.1 DUF6152 family protein [Gammaproteobacteria bacterium]